MSLIGNGRLLTSTVLVGCICGLFFTVVQQIDALPLLFGAEAAVSEFTQQHHNDAANPPSDQTLRSLARNIANIILATGYAALLLAVMRWSCRRRARLKVTPASGIMWGAAGYMTLYLLPALFYPPRTPAADLITASHGDAVLLDQLGWLAVSLLSSLCLWMLVFGEKRTKLVIAGLMVATSLAVLLFDLNLEPGAYLAETSRGSQLREQNYRYSSYLSNLLFWLLLGFCSALLSSYLARPRPR